MRKKSRVQYQRMIFTNNTTQRNLMSAKMRHKIRCKERDRKEMLKIRNVGLLFKFEKNDD